MTATPPSMPPPSCCVVGRGRLGRGLTRCWRDAGVRVRSTPGRTPSPEAIRRAEVVLLAVPDPAIESLAERIAPWLGRRPAAVLHAAGRLDASILAACARAGAPTGVLHPLVSFADAGRPPRLTESCFVAHGHPEAMRRAHALIRALGARWVAHPVHGPLYHAAAALLANGAVGLAHAADQALEAAGLPPSERRAALASLLQSVADNLRRMPPPDALSGPVRRGDAQAVATHLEALRSQAPHAATAYERILPSLVQCAKEAGLDSNSAARLARMVQSSPA